MSAGLELAASVYGALWEARRRGYAAGLLKPRRVPARVVSIGNLTAGGTGKTTLALHLGRLAAARGSEFAVVCRNYRPGPAGRGDEELLYAQALGEARVFAGSRKRAQAAAAAAAGAELILVDDGFSTWNLARDLDLVLLDRNDLWGGGRLLPAGWLREPRRALQRAQVVVISRLAAGEEPGPWLDQVRPYAPAAWLASARHRVEGTRALVGPPLAPGARVRIVTATGNPAAVAASAREAGFQVVALSARRDHHWFTPAEARAEVTEAGRAAAAVLLTGKDAVRWPAGPAAATVAVLEVAWEWVTGGEETERMVLGGEPYDG